jgi:bifunctional non-homologous end joining protein LigD
MARSGTRPASGGAGERGELKEYRRKRDFRKSAEPAGAARQGSGGGLTFVVQKHAASHLHYDLRLEAGGVMKSWAVPKGPSLDPAVRRLAMQVEDHPVDYNTFEGTIPAGEYGGGTVMLWDRGHYSPEDVRAGETEEAAVRRGLRAGKLSFTLHGERLRGTFALVRTARGEKPKWLLFKQRGAGASEAREITERVRTSVATGRTMEEIEAEGDRVWRSNRSASDGGEEKGASAPAPAGGAATLAPVRPRPARAHPESAGWSLEPWRGGTRMLAYAAASGARLQDERGRDRTARHPALADELASLASRVGEPFVLEAEVVGDGSDAALFACDLLARGEQVLIQQPREARRAALEALLKRRRLRAVSLQPVYTSASAARRRAERDGWSGIIARRLDAPYPAGRRSDAVLRLPAA